MTTDQDKLSASRRRALIPRLLARLVLRVAAVAALLTVVAWTAVLTKQSRVAPPLAFVETVGADRYQTAPVLMRDTVAATVPTQPATDSFEPSPAPHSSDPDVRWFNGRPVRPGKSIDMLVTAYSPDAKSCGDSADGITATLHSVHTNGFKLVASDPKVLPMGSMLSIPGYGEDMIVPVLDVGGKIKGNRLDVLFPTHEQALTWGARCLKVTVWEFADGKPAENPRKLR